MLEDLATAVQAWIDDDPDPETADDLTDLLDLAGDTNDDETMRTAARTELADRFAGFLEFGTSASKITTTSIPTSSAIATPRITNHRAGRNGHLPLCLAIEPPIAVMIGDAHASATIPPINARSGERRRPSRRRTPNAYKGTIRTTPRTTNKIVRPVTPAGPIVSPECQRLALVRSNRRPGQAVARTLLCRCPLFGATRKRPAGRAWQQSQSSSGSCRSASGSS